MSAPVMALVPARGGSKGLPRKNVLPLAGKPLIAHSIEQASSCRLIDRVVVSTDDEEIAEVARTWGAEVPFLRPKGLAEDDTPDLPVFVHALEWLRENERYEPDIVVHLRPTSPLRTVAQIERAIALLRGEPRADSVRSVCEPIENPFKMWRIGSDGFLEPLVPTAIPEAYNQPRQALPTAYWQTGYVDAVRAATILEQRSMTGRRILPLLIEGVPIIDIDSRDDFEAAEALSVRAGLVEAP